MQLNLWGTDFRRSSSKLRAFLYLEEEKRAEVLKKICALGFEDMLYVHTCNRIEFVTTCTDFYSDLRPLWFKMFELLGLDKECFYQGYQFEGKSCVRHLTRVASSLESMVVGEPQILGQLKASYQFNLTHKLPLSSHMHHVMKFVLQTAKEVRHKTKIGKNSVSVANLGLTRLQKIEEDYPLTRAVVVGRGPMSLLVLRWLLKNRPEVPLVWVNRDVSKLEAFHEAHQTSVRSLEEFKKDPGEFSHLFTATASDSPVFCKNFLSSIASPSAFFDFAHPPDMEKADEPHLQIFFDDLKQEAQANEQTRQKAIDQSEKIIADALRRFYQEQKEMPLVKDFSSIESKLLQEFEEAMVLLEGKYPEESLEFLRHWAYRLVKKNLHLSRDHLKSILRQFTEPANLDKKLG